MNADNENEFQAELGAELDAENAHANAHTPFKNEYLMSFQIEGIYGGSSYITVENGKVDSSGVEEEFFSILRKTEKILIKDTENEEKSHIIDTLTPAQEEKLKEAHMKDYRGTDDDAPDAYDDWLIDLSLEELKAIL
jgi:hypothetical protein